MQIKHNWSKAFRKVCQTQLIMCLLQSQPYQSNPPTYTPCKVAMQQKNTLLLQLILCVIVLLFDVLYFLQGS